ncbi:MAG: sel1 repeat family protein [Rhodospirillaceae bacterium]|nr:sel1 repeat family protein [Rhodospirillaceae bacterium]
MHYAFTHVARPSRAWFIGILTLLIWAAIAAPSALARTTALDTEHRGIRLVAVTLPPAGSQDVDVMALKPAMANIKKAIDVIYARSPFSAKRIEQLRNNGRVTLVYDAEFPKAKMASSIIAAFFPDFFQAKKNGRKEFLVVIGRYGVKWPTDKLAAVIVHELVGHGLQHLRGRTGKDRKLDKECEALIYEEKAYQDFDVRRDTRDMQQFRLETRDNWCADFRRHLTQSDLNADKAWNYGKPDVPKLLTHFDAYIDHLRKSGVAGKAVAAAKAKRQGNFSAMLRRAESGGSSRDMYAIASRYLKGLGVKRDTANGIAWMRKAAEFGHAQAQYIMGTVYSAGHGVQKDPAEAYKWLTLSANRGFPKAKKARRKLKPNLTPAQLTEANKRLKTWRPAKRG